MTDQELAERNKAAETPPRLNPFQLLVLGGLQKKHVYGGTVDPEVVRRRRSRNRAASKSRRRNRMSK